MSRKLTVAIAQTHTRSTTEETLTSLRTLAYQAARKNVSILLFPEAYLGGYPRTCSFGASIGARTAEGREQFRAYYNQAVDLGDTFRGEGQAWTSRTLPVNSETGRRGDGTREYLEDVARETGVFIVTGLVERAGSSLFCCAVYVDPSKGVIAKRRKVMPTGTERLVWAQGSPSTLKVVSTTIRGVKVVMGTAICWENYMPLLRYAIYSQGVNLWLAPTADARDTWESLIKTIASEGRCFVLSCNQCSEMKDLPSWATAGSGQKEDHGATNETVPAETTTPGLRRTVSTKTADDHEIAWKTTSETSDKDTEKEHGTRRPDSATTKREWATRGGSCIVGPMGNTIEGPIWEAKDCLVCTEIDFDECDRGKMDFDATAHYSRHDAFNLTVEGLDLIPPP